MPIGAIKRSKIEMKELFDQKYVFILWDKKLDGKKGFVAQNIASLRSQVNDNPKNMVTLSSSDDDVCPFTYYVDDEILEEVLKIVLV